MLTESIIIGRGVRIPARILRVEPNPTGPHFLEVQFVDAHGRAWSVTDKDSVLTTEEVWPETEYAQDAEIHGMIVGRNITDDGRPVVMVDTRNPWHIEAEDGNTRFEMSPEALDDIDPKTHATWSPKPGPPVSLNHFHLLPVVKVTPYPYQREGRQSPDCSSAEDPEAWFAYWQDSLADSGIAGLAPIKKGRWLVPTAAFTASTRYSLNAVLAGIWNHDETDPADLEGTPLCGGLAVVGYDGSVWLAPQCCGDLGNIVEWERVAHSPPAEWTPLWTGHPQPHVKHADDSLVFSECTDQQQPEREVFSLPMSNFGRLHDQLRQAREELTRFAQQVETALAAYGCRGNLAAAAFHLCGLDKQPSISS